MRRALTFLTALTAATALAACSGEDETGVDESSSAEPSSEESSDDGAGQTGDAASDGDAAQTSDAAGDAAAGISDDPICQGFFAGQGTPLAERTQTQRDVVAPGDDLDAVSYSEMTLLSGRLLSLADDADGEQAALLERINAPFQEVTDAVVEDGTRTDDTIAIPEVDVADSAAAQDELEAACQA